MIVKKAKRANEEWPVEDHMYFLNYFIDNYKNKAEELIFEQIAQRLERSYDAIKMRSKEVVGILTDKERGLYNITPNLTYALQEVMNERQLSKDKMLIIFE